MTRPDSPLGAPAMALAAPLTPPHRRLRAGAVKRCPSCRTPLDGGPVRFRCYPCGAPVMAADLDTEYHPADPRPAESLGADADPARTVPDGRHAG